MIHWEDLSHILGKDGYWASYNNAYFADVRATSGANEECEYDNSYCYDLDPRAQLFNKYQSQVVDIKSMERMMGYNRWKFDKISDK